MFPPLLLLTLECERQRVFYLTLISHTAVSYAKCRGVRICLVQHAKSHGHLGVRSTNDYRLSLSRQRNFGIKREDITTQNVKPRERAHMLAISRATFGAPRYKTYSGTREDVALERVKVLLDSGDVVALISRYRDNATQNLEDIASVNDRKMIAKVLAEIRKLIKQGIKVEITQNVVGDTAVGNRASAKAKMIAKRTGRKASGYFQKRAQARVAVKELGDGLYWQMTLELPMRLRTH
jgi:hypothetical protein